jgi:serine/threonine protein kinase
MSHSQAQLSVSIASASNAIIPITRAQVDFVKNLLKEEDSFLFSQSKLKELISKKDATRMNEIPFRILKIKDPNNHLSQDKYFLVEKTLLGKGQEGKIKTVIDLDTGEKFALKIIPVSDAYEDRTDEVMVNYQFKILEKIKEAHGVVIRKKTPEADSKMDRIPKRYLLINLAQGTNLRSLLQAHAERKIYFSPVELMEISLLAVSAIKDLHEKGVLHRDIKLENIVYDPTNKILKLVDFGCAIEIKYAHRVTSTVGTSSYLADEVRKDDEAKYSVKSDVYALGILLKRIWGFEEFPDENDEYYITNNKTFEDTTPAFREMLVSLINKMTTENPDERMTAIEAGAALEEMLLANRLNLSIASPTEQKVSQTSLSLLSPASTASDYPASSPLSQNIRTYPERQSSPASSISSEGSLMSPSESRISLFKRKLDSSSPESESNRPRIQPPSPKK